MRKAFAADFGAGNTCLYWINPDAAAPVCTALNDPGGEPSGYAIYQDGKIVLGLGLYGLWYDDLKNIQEFHINLKGVPNEENRQELTNYFRLWRERIMKERAKEFEDLDESYWFMGCPTGAEWKSKEVRELYKKIFEDAGFKNVYIVPESNGALAFFEKTNRVLEECGTNKKLFLIDLGAYSIDATPYFGGSLGTSYGKYLGASLIDRMILRTILYGDEQKFRKGKKIINLPEILKTARVFYKNSETPGKFSSYMLLQARKLKEDYFTKESKGFLPKGNLTFNSGFFVGQGDDKEELVLFTNPKMMKILMEETPIREVLGEEFYTLKKEVVDYVGNLTWMDTLRKFLGELGKEYKIADKGADAVIMLTGGGSLMKCVADEVKNFFPKAAIHYDPQAISAIGQGIAYWAPDKIKAILFEKKYREDFLEKNNRNFIAEKFDRAFEECVADIAEALTEEEENALNFGIEQWKTYKCSSYGIPGKIESHFKDWCTNTGIPTFNSNLAKRINNLKDALNADFKNNVLDPLKMLTGKPEDDTLLKTDNKTFLSVSKELLKAMFDFWTDALVYYYKNHSQWNNFSNPSDGIFTNPRKSFYNDNAGTLNTWIAHETEATVELSHEYFCEWHLARKSELEHMGSDVFQKAVTEADLCDKCFGSRSGYLDRKNNPTLMKHYSDEGCDELESLMRKRKKEILGKLVLEELLNDE